MLCLLVKKIKPKAFSATLGVYLSTQVLYGLLSLRLRYFSVFVWTLVLAIAFFSVCMDFCICAYDCACFTIEIQ